MEKLLRKRQRARGLMDPEVKSLPPMAKQFLKYASVGAVGTTGHYAVYVPLVNLGLSVVLSSMAGFVVGALINYWLNYHYTFKSDRPHHQAVIRFLSVALVGLALNTVIVFMLDRMQWHYLLAQAGATMLVLVWNFSANRYWTFRGD